MHDPELSRQLLRDLNGEGPAVKQARLALYVGVSVETYRSWKKTSRRISATTRRHTQPREMLFHALGPENAVHLRNSNFLNPAHRVGLELLREVQGGAVSPSKATTRISLSAWDELLRYGVSDDLYVQLQHAVETDPLVFCKRSDFEQLLTYVVVTTPPDNGGSREAALKAIARCLEEKALPYCSELTALTLTNLGTVCSPLDQDRNDANPALKAVQQRVSSRDADFILEKLKVVFAHYEYPKEPFWKSAKRFSEKVLENATAGNFARIPLGLAQVYLTLEFVAEHFYPRLRNAPSYEAFHEHVRQRVPSEEIA